MSRNNVRGPTSALTEFLRASGITPTTVARRAQPIAGPSGAQGEDNNAGQDDGDEEESASPRRRRARTRNSVAGAVDYDSDHLDDPEEPEPPSKKQKLSKAAQAKAKAKAKQKAKGKKDEDGEYEEDEEEDAYKALSKMWCGSDAKPAVGSFEDCAKCETKFTVTKYTMAAVPGPGFLCHKCAKASGSDPFKKPAPPKRKKTSPAEKRNVTYFEEKKLPSLVSLCIQIVTKYINDIEAFGNIGALNMDAISKALSKNRSLTPQNAQLFYASTNTHLRFYDATNLTSSALTTLFHLNPALTSLHLDFCGHLDDAVMHVLSTSLHSLTSLTLLGPFLVRAPAWQEFIKSHPGLTAFRITQSPRFDLDCMKELVQNNMETLKALRLREIGQLNDAFLVEIGKLGSGGVLRELDVADPGHECSEESLIKLMQSVGAGLTVLDLSGHRLVSDVFLCDGLKAHCRQLASLALSHVPLVTTEGVTAVFTEWGNPPLVSLKLSRNPELKGEALVAIMKHSGRRLEELDVNGWGEVDQAALRAIGKGVELRTLDVGWCREVDDFVVKEWMEGEEGGNRIPGCKRLREVKVWGCNKLTVRCPMKPGVRVHGVESHTTL